MTARRATRAEGSVEGALLGCAPKTLRGALSGEGLHGAHGIERLAASDTMSAPAPAPRATEARTLRPKMMIGRHTTGTTASTRSASLGCHHQHGDSAHAHQRVAQRHRGRRADHLHVSWASDEMRLMTSPSA
jgi:hypothetical protein